MQTPAQPPRTKRFQPSAHLDIVPEGHILRLEAAGPFNKALVIYLFLMGRDLLADAVSRNIPYAVIINFHRSLVMTPDSIKQLVELLEDNDRRGGPPPVATAYVVRPDIDGATLMLPILADIYRKTRAFDAFSAHEDADVWVRTLMAQKRAEAPAQP